MKTLYTLFVLGCLVSICCTCATVLYSRNTDEMLSGLRNDITSFEKEMSLLVNDRSRISRDSVASIDETLRGLSSHAEDMETSMATREYIKTALLLGSLSGSLVTLFCVLAIIKRKKNAKQRTAPN